MITTSPQFSDLRFSVGDDNVIVTFSVHCQAQTGPPTIHCGVVLTFAVYCQRVRTRRVGVQFNTFVHPSQLPVAIADEVATAVIVQSPG